MLCFLRSFERIYMFPQSQPLTSTQQLPSQRLILPPLTIYISPQPFILVPVLQIPDYLHHRQSARTFRQPSPLISKWNLSSVSNKPSTSVWVKLDYFVRFVTSIIFQFNVMSQHRFAEIRDFAPWLHEWMSGSDVHSFLPLHVRAGLLSLVSSCWSPLVAFISITSLFGYRYAIQSGDRSDGDFRSSRSTCFFISFMRVLYHYICLPLDFF